MLIHQFPITAARNGTTSQKYTQTRKGLIVLPPPVLRAPVRTTRRNPAMPTTWSATWSGLSQRPPTGRAASSLWRRGSGQSHVSATKEMTRAVPAPTTK